jgi:Fe-S-cluster containining protein
MRLTSRVEFDCRRCGACCANPDENRVEGVVDWVEVRIGEPLLDDARLVRRLVVTNAAGERHLRLDASGRCLALRGTIGRCVSCDVYAVRPDGCRRVEPGDERCRQYRRERGVDR